jgi:glycosyltransferase, group 2 family protein
LEEEVSFIKNKVMISILIPVYNTASYLADCFNSVINQSYQDFEVIVIDNGSTDESAQICDEWAKKYAQIKVFHQENQGLIAARREGWKHAAGEWMMFLDSDDMLPKDSLKTLHAAAEHTDMVIGACGGGGMCCSGELIACLQTTEYHGR